MSDKRVEKNKLNVENIKKLLLAICENPNDFSDNNELKKAISSQSRISKYEDKENNIIKSSINTLKRTSEKIYPNGFEEIEKLRILANEKLNQVKKSSSLKSNSKEYYKVKYEESKKELENQREVNLVAINQLMSEIQLLKNIKQSDNIELIHGLCSKQIAKLQSTSLNYTDFAPLKKETFLKLVKGEPNE